MICGFLDIGGEKFLVPCGGQLVHPGDDSIIKFVVFDVQEYSFFPRLEALTSAEKFENAAFWL